MNLEDKYLTKDQQTLIKNIPDERRWNNYRNFDLELETWDKFWNNYYDQSKENELVLDFGCGAAYNEVVAKKLKKANVVSLDIDTKEVKIVFGRFHEITGVKADYWNGKEFKYEDNKFDAITSKASLSKLVKSDWETVLSELIRVTKNNGVWYISPLYMISRLDQNGSKKIKNMIKEKNITIVGWEWDLDDPRNRYWKNFKKVTPKDELGVHDYDYKKR